MLLIPLQVTPDSGAGDPISAIAAKDAVLAVMGLILLASFGVIVKLVKYVLDQNKISLQQAQATAQLIEVMRQIADNQKDNRRMIDGLVKNGGSSIQ